MKALWLAAMLLVPGGDRERGLQLYREGKFAAAADAFRAAIASDGDSAELQWNLALAGWRAGQVADAEAPRKERFSAAEAAVEKYAALSSHAQPALHRGLLGAIRFDEAKALEAKADGVAAQPAPAQPSGSAAPGAQPEDPLPLLEQALGKAEQARDHFVAAAEVGPSAEIARNMERALRLIDELQKKIEDLKQREEQKKDDQKDENKKNDEKDPQKKPEEKKPDEKDGEKKDDKSEPKEPEPKKGDDAKDPPKDGQQGEPQQPPEPKPGEKPEEPKAGDQNAQDKPAPEQNSAEEKSEPQKAQPRADAPGESSEAKELSPEQTQRLLEMLKELEQKRKVMRGKSSRPKVERDW